MRCIIFIACYIILLFTINVDSLTCRKKRCKGKTKSAKEITCLKSACENSILSARNNITCEGDVSCLGATLGSTKADIVCTGERSCKESDMIAGNNVYCSGFKSCSEATSITAGNDIIISGYLGAYFVDSITASGDITCIGTNACWASTLIATNIYCLDFAPSNWNTFVVEDSVTCNGYQACHNAKISSSTNTLSVSCSQTYSCMDTEVTCPDGYCKITCNGAPGVSGCLSGTFDDTEIYYTANTSLIVEPAICDTRNGGAGDKNCPNLNLISVEERDEMLRNKASRVLPDDAYIHDNENEEIDDGQYINDEFIAFVADQDITEKGINISWRMVLFILIGVIIGATFMTIIKRFLPNSAEKYEILE